MKISILLLDITLQHGIERTTSLLANTFANHNHDVTIVSIFKSGKVPGFDLNKNIKVKYLINEEYSHKNSIFKIINQYIHAIYLLHKFYKKYPQEVIIGQAFLCCLFLFLIGKAKKSYACEHFKYGMYNKLIRNIRNYCYKKFITVVTLTDSDASKYKKHNIKVTTIPNMLPFNISEKETCKEQKKRIISVGRLHKQKGYDLLLLALKNVFDKYNDWHIYIYGEGDERKNLEKMRDDLGLKENVFFPGHCNNIQEEYYKSSFYIMSSRYEGFPMVLLEAMSCGLPIISFDCPEGPSVLLKNNVGILVPKENIKALSQAICKLIENEDLRFIYSKKSIKTCKLYTPESIYNLWINLFQKE